MVWRRGVRHTGSLCLTWSMQIIENEKMAEALCSNQRTSDDVRSQKTRIYCTCSQCDLPHNCNFASKMCFSTVNVLQGDSYEEIASSQALDLQNG